MGLNWTKEEYTEYIEHRNATKRTECGQNKRVDQKVINTSCENKTCGRKAKKSKYGNKKNEVDGIKFDSIKESREYLRLKSMLEANVIAGFEMQVKFLLQDSFFLDGERFRAINYIADFVVEHHDGKKEIIDVKASKRFQDPVYKLKKKMFMKMYGIKITEIY